MEIEEDDGGSSAFPINYTSGISEITEVDDQETATVKEKPKKIAAHFVGDDNDDNVYVAVGKSDTSLGALRWALKNSVKPSSWVFLVHIFPEVKHISTALGKLPRSHASPEQLENFLTIERSKRIQLLSRFLNLCSQVRVDTILIESDNTAKAILDLIPVLNIKKLVLGTNKSSLKKGRKKGIADVLQRGAPEYCEVSIICEGKDVSREMMMLGMPTTPIHTNTGTSSPSHPHVPVPLHSDEAAATATTAVAEANGGNEAINRSPKQSSHSTSNKHHKNKRKDHSFSLCLCFTGSP